MKDMGSSTLLFRHLPKELSIDERRDFLHHFGANRVRVFEAGKMVNAAFATFNSKEHAAEVLRQLHQVAFLGSTLVVEFARDASQAPSVVDDEGKVALPDEALKEKAKAKDESQVKPAEIKFDSTFGTWGIKHPRPPHLRYHYPPPSGVILTNIMNALASVPKFYVQVLHLMNKLDLPCPFGPLTAAPPLQQSIGITNQTMGCPRDLGISTQDDDIDQREMDISSETESELESDEEDTTKLKSKEELEVQRLHRSRKPRLKRPRLTALQKDISDPIPPPSFPLIPVTAVFDQTPESSTVTGKKIEMKIPQTVSSTFHLNTRARDGEERMHSYYDIRQNHPLPPPSSLIQRHSNREQQRLHTEMVTDTPIKPHPLPPAPPTVTTAFPPAFFAKGESQARDTEAAAFDNVPMPEDHNADLLSSSGFGIITPTPKKSTEEEVETGAEEPNQWGKSKFISSSRLKKGRLTESEMREMNIFKKYVPGETSCRLYIKNVSKQASEKDLHWVFGRYVDWDSEVEQNIFDIRLMKEGRMKGQAFVTLPSEEVATDALRDTNGFMLKDKPLVVQFARTAKAQEDPSSIITQSR